jgi:orotate phosphoribosyltransferase
VNGQNEMTDNLIKTLPVRRGHFLLESGYHTDLWLTLDAMFVSPYEMVQHVAALSGLLRPHQVSAVCGPLQGGAFLAQALAAYMNLRFYFTQQTRSEAGGSLFAAQYRLLPELRRRISKERVAIVDDCISAGSSVRATASELDAAGAEIAVVGSILLLGNQAEEHFSARGVSVVALVRQEFNLWAPAECPLCRAGANVENPVASTSH